MTIDWPNLRGELGEEGMFLYMCSLVKLPVELENE